LVTAVSEMALDIIVCRYQLPAFDLSLRWY
jgi:hypothetical protein